MTNASATADQRATELFALHKVVQGQLSGNLFFLDLVDEIQEIPAGAANIQTFAANSASGFGGDGRPAAQAQLDFPIDAVADKAGNVYIAVTGAVRKVEATSGVIQTIAGRGIGGTTSLSGDGGRAGHKCDCQSEWACRGRLRKRFYPPMVSTRCVKSPPPRARFDPSQGMGQRGSVAMADRPRPRSFSFRVAFLSMPAETFLLRIPATT